MPTFVAFILACLVARLVYDVLAPYGVQALNVGLSRVAWFVRFSLRRPLSPHEYRFS